MTVTTHRTYRITIIRPGRLAYVFLTDGIHIRPDGRIVCNRPQYGDTATTITADSILSIEVV